MTPEETTALRNYCKDLSEDDILSDLAYYKMKILKLQQEIGNIRDTMKVMETILDEGV